jgi:FkbM family methyltransferase
MVHISRWQPSRHRAALERLALPLVRLLNRPSLAGFDRLLLEFALRCNGLGNNLETDAGLTHAEERFLRHHAASRLRPWPVLDVGANAGGYARFVRGLDAEVPIIAFEPHPDTYARLSAAVGALGVEALNLAVSDAPGEAMLHDFPDQDGSTQASLDPEVIRLHGGKEPVAHRVRCVTLDDFAQARGIERISLLKIDTEGFDLAVLRGAQRLLSERRVGIIHFEFIASNIVRRIAMRDFFEALEGYTIHRLCLNGALLPLGAYDPKLHELYVRHNLIALPAGSAAIA